jgi:hypothetical protein
MERHLIAKKKRLLSQSAIDKCILLSAPSCLPQLGAQIETHIW